jgi:hypothetical protein
MPRHISRRSTQSKQLIGRCVQRRASRPSGSTRLGDAANDARRVEMAARGP